MHASCRASPHLCLPPCPSWPPAPFRAGRLPEAFCSAANTARDLVAFHSSFLCLSLSGSPPAPLFFHSSRTLFCPLAWQNGISRSPSTQRPVAVLSDCLCSAPCRSSNVLSLGLSVQLPLPISPFLPVWPGPRCFLNFLSLAAVIQFPVSFISSCLSSASALLQVCFSVFISLVC